MELTTKDLPELAGWQAMKKARALVAAGSVAKAERTVGDTLLFRGLVIEGRRKYACGLQIRSISDADNLCSCPAARRDGQICEHSVAVALQALENPEDDIEKSSQGPATKVFKTNPTQSAWLPTLPKGIESWDGRRALPMRLCNPDPDLVPIAGFQERVTRQLESMGARPEEKAQLLSLDSKQFLQLLEASVGGAFAIDSVKASTRASSFLSIAETFTRLPLTLRPHPKRDGVALLRRPALVDTLFLGGAPNFWILRSSEQLAIRVPVGTTSATLSRIVAPLFAEPEREVEIEVESDWLRDQFDHLHCMFHMECSDELIDQIRVTFGTPTVSLHVEGSLNRIDLKLSFQYQAGETPNPELERAALSRIPSSGDRPGKASAGDSSDAARRSSQIFIRGQDAILDFYAGVLDQLITEGQWDIQIGERFAHLTQQIEKVRPRCTINSEGNDWLEMDLSFTSEGGDVFSEAEIRRLLATGQSGLKMRNGRRAAIDRSALSKLYEGLAEAETSISEPGLQHRRIPTSQQFYIEEVTKDITSKISTENTPNLIGFEAELRDYQSTGVAWMNRRVLAGHGAVLADEMGLGKTVQSLALISSIGGSSSAPTLILCPTSMIRTWEREAARFVPDRSVLVLHGPGRAKLLEQILQNDIVITSYGSLVRDIDSYADIQFRLVIADEASFLRNPRTKTTKAAGKLDATSRIALTGTPIENSIQDLWSIMNFTNPGYLGRRDDFVARHSAAGGDSASRLKTRLNPYLLRRTKSEVASDLPAKLERVIYCELSAKQRAVYEQLLRKSRENFKTISAGQNWQSSRLEVLTVLLRLRQACCDLRLLGGEGASAADSAKLAAFDTLVSEALAGGHRILVFSQFVSMLKLLREQLDAAGHRYAYLDGSTPADQRASQVEAFQAGGELPIFLISLKAGGYGLTLTEADTVIHFDPWWNPAVEAQATDRAHRIGQTNPVTAYKLITSGTVEEKILRLQERKRDLVASALDEQRPLMDSLSREDIDFVLS